ncbi:YlbF family regulator [Candidatus Arthromitus sp. SFB-rat-Yit]|uniref:YlbF family regulator n=1 Tax=Candidatus Arthromitus sp. SFB-rat-Yit TaxID=1041504 RepID=UPI000227A0E2|nr:YlbF family regulator [Candidatus Arthromitus sp. SFB-rat-Yit]BAK81257.1 hypothetical protein RATSFB_0695 [Candidatus Arthromitus sp. SFB-rat-Yit]
MINIHDKAHELANSIKQMEEVKKLKEISEKIKADESLTSLLKELRDVQFLVFNEQRSEGKLEKETEEKFKIVSQKVMANPVVAEYVQYEQKVGIIVDDIMKILNEAFGIQSFV